MNSHPDVALLADRVRTLYEENPEQALSSIENYLEQEIRRIPPEEKLTIIQELAANFAPALPTASGPSPQTDAQFLRFCSILLGQPVQATDLQGETLQTQLTEALTVIFETLNKLIATINITLQSGSQPQETIRFLIGQHLDDDLGTAPLQAYLEQIHTSFLTTHRAFQSAMKATVEKILTELDPESIAEKEGGGLGFNPLRKVDNFNRYAKRYSDCRKWFDSGRCMEEFLRTFEKQCATMLNSPKEVLS